MNKKLYIIEVTDDGGRPTPYESTMSWQCAMDVLHNRAMGARANEKVRVYAYNLDWKNEVIGEGECVALYVAPERPQDRITAHVTMPQF